jgi:hypothetical protein
MASTAGGSVSVSAQWGLYNMVVTRADIYEKAIFAKRPVYPHCGQEIKIWQCARTAFVCGSR